MNCRSAFRNERVNVADLGATPVILQYGPAVSASVSAFCAAYNQVLEGTLAVAGIPTIRLDIFTTVVQRLTVDAARNCLVDYFSPARGKGMPPAQVNALNGLVRAGKGQ